MSWSIHPHRWYFHRRNTQNHHRLRKDRCEQSRHHKERPHTIGTGIVVSIVAVITSFFETQLEVAVATNGRLTKTGTIVILIVITIIAGFVTILTWDQVSS